MRITKLKLMNIVLIMAMFYAFSSCLNVEEDEKVYTKEQEKKDLESLITKLKEKYTVKTTESGMYYIVPEAGDSLSDYYAQLGDSLHVRFRGYLLNGQLFSSSKNLNNPADDDSYNFRLEKDKMLKGWIEAMQMMKKGSKMRFIMPSDLAYGSNGTSGIPPYQALIFDAEMLKIIKQE